MAKVLITGCNSGFGYYTTECFAKAGHPVGPDAQMIFDNRASL